MDARELALDKLRRTLLSEYNRYYLRGGWRKVSEKHNGVSAGTLCSISKGYDPKSKTLCKKLNIPYYAPAPVCVTCGEVHTTKRCTKVKRQARDLFSLPVDELAKMIRERTNF